MNRLICTMKNRQFLILAVCLITGFFTSAQTRDCLLYIRSHVDARTWTLTTKPHIVEQKLPEAVVTLYSGTKVISETKTDINGAFTVLTPFGGEYEMVISYPGCNSKKISVTATGVTIDALKNNFISTFSISKYVRWFSHFLQLITQAYSKIYLK